MRIFCYDFSKAFDGVSHYFICNKLYNVGSGRRHLAGKPVVASPNVDCFLRLLLSTTPYVSYDNYESV